MVTLVCCACALMASGTVNAAVAANASRHRVMRMIFHPSGPADWRRRCPYYAFAKAAEWSAATELTGGAMCHAPNTRIQFAQHRRSEEEVLRSKLLCSTSRHT